MFNSILYAEDTRPLIKSELLHAVVDSLISAKVKNFVPSINEMKVYSELREADYRISESDIIHATCAKILVIPLVTTDNMMLNSHELKKRVEIISPADVL